MGFGTAVRPLLRRCVDSGPGQRRCSWDGARVVRLVMPAGWGQQAPVLNLRGCQRLVQSQGVSSAWTVCWPML